MNNYDMNETKIDWTRKVEMQEKKQESEIEWKIKPKIQKEKKKCNLDKAYKIVAIISLIIGFVIMGLILIKGWKAIKNIDGSLVVEGIKKETTEQVTEQVIDPLREEIEGILSLSELDDVEILFN